MGCYIAVIRGDPTRDKMSCIHGVLASRSWRKQSCGGTRCHAGPQGSVAGHDGRWSSYDGHAERESGTCIAGDGQAVTSCEGTSVSTRRSARLDQWLVANPFDRGRMRVVLRRQALLRPQQGAQRRLIDAWWVWSYHGEWKGLYMQVRSEMCTNILIGNFL